MGAYLNYVQDLPKRCVEVLEAFRYCAQKIGLEVTFLLSVATPCIILPYERLKKGKHPSKDHKTFDKAKKTLDDKLINKCGESGLWSNPNNWRFKKLDRTFLQDDPYQWGLKEGTESITDKEAGIVLDILRHALAHGSIWTMGNPIDTLVFVSLEKLNKECKGPFNTIQCSPQELCEFLIKWAGFLSKLEIPPDQCIET